MKKLNQNNAIATTAMLTKTNAMKDKVNFFAKVVMLVVMMGIFATTLYADTDTQSESNGKPYYDNGVWYSLFASTEKKGDKDFDRKPFVYPPTNQIISFEYWGIEGTRSFYRSLEVNQLLDGSSWQLVKITPDFRNNDYESAHKQFSDICDIDILQISIKIHDYNLYGKWKSKDIKIPLKHHVRLFNENSDNSVGVTSTSRNFGNTILIGSTDEDTINIRSFLTTTNLKMKVIQATGDAQSTTDVKDVFKIRYLTQVYNGEVTITNTANVCGYPGATGNKTSSSNQATPINTSSIPVVIEYHPNEALTRKARLIFYDGSNVLAYVDLEGTGVKKTPTFNWKITDMALDDAAKSISDIVEMTQIDATGAITIFETNQDGSMPPTSPKLSIANGQVSVLEDVPTGVTYLKASYDGNSTYESATSGPQEFTISQNQLQERNIYWTADFTSLRDNQGTIDLTISPWKATTDPNNGNVDDYIVDDPSIASVSDDKTTLTIHKEGITTITAIKNADATYKKATMTKTLVVSSSSGCTKYWINASPNKTSDYTCPSFNGRPREVVWTIETNDNDHSIGTVYLQTVNGQTIKAETTARDKENVYRTPITGNDTTLRQFKVTGLKGWEAFNYGKRTLIGFQVVMASYLDEIPNNYIAFGEYDNFSTKPLTNKSIAYYQNIPGNISVEVVDVDEGSNNTWDCFTFPNGSRELSITGGCENKGTATINLNFTPKQVGEHKARLKVSAYDGNSDEKVTFYIPISGTGKKLTQTLTWNNAPTHLIFTGTYNTTSENLSLTGAALTSGMTTSAGALTVTYSSSNPDVADVVKDANGVQYIDFKQAGTFKLRANCQGNSVYSDAAQIESGDINVALTDAVLVINPITNPYVFSTITPTLQTRTTDATAVTYTYKDNNGTTLTTGASYKLPSIVSVNIVANTPATNVYKAGTSAPITVTPQKVTPVISSFATLAKGYVGTPYNLSGNADWAEASGQPARSEWINGDGVSIIYTSSKHDIADDGVTFTPKKAGVTTISASIEAANNHTASSPSGNDQQPLQIDFNQGGPLYTFSQNTKVGESTTEEISLANYFVPSGTYTVSVSGTGFQIEGNTSVDKSTNKFSVKFTAQTFDANLTNKDYTATITITDADSRVYSFTIKATAVKRDAGLTISYTGETFAFSKITLSNTKATTADVTYMVNGVTITGTTYKIPSVAPITISATTPATDTHKAGSVSLEPFTPKKVTPKVTNWSGSYADQKVGGSIALGQADWDVDETVSGQPAKAEWAPNEVTITYTPSDSRIAEVSGSNLVFHRAGLATIEASIAEEKNHNASTNNPSKTVKVDFADEAVNCGTMYVGETPATADITDRIVTVGTLTYTTNNNDFSVDFSNNKIVVKYNPSAYHSTSNGTIIFTDTDDQQYHLNVSAGCLKHAPVIEWKDDKTLALSANPEMKSLNELLKSCSYCEGATIKTSDATVVTVFKSDGTPAGEGEGGETFWAHGNGLATITIEIPETDSHTASSSQATFTVSGIEDTRVSWNQSLVFEYNGTPGQQESLTAKAYRITSNEETGQSITYEIVSQNPSGIVSLTQDANGNKVLSPLIINGTGTATIKAIATATANYASSESSVRTITINEPASTSECSFLIGTIQNGTGEYNFKKEDHTDYYEVEEISYNYNVTGNNGSGYDIVIYDFRQKGDPKTIKCDVKNGNEIITSLSKEYTADGGNGANGTPENKNGSESISIPEGQQVTSVTFTVPNGDNDIALTNVTIKPRKYLKNTSTTSHTFGSSTAIFVGQSETAQLTIAEYAFLNGNQVDMKLVNLNDDGDYAGGEFTILDKSDGDDWGKSCDYGKIKVHVQFAPLSGRDDAVHKCRIMMKGTIGNNQTSAVYFTLEGKAQRNPQQVIWTQDLSNWNSQTGEVFLGASSNQSDVTGTMEYEIISQTAATSRETTGVVDIIDDNKLKIYKAGTVTIKAKHPGDDKYEPAEDERTFTISRVNPDINLSHNSTDIVESSQIDVTLGEAPYTISGSAKYGDKVIPGYATGTGEKITFSSSETDVVSIVDDNKLKFNSAGTATITASIATDDIVNAASFTFTVNVGPSNQVVTITNDLTRKLVTTDTENGITLTATAVNELDATMISDGTITYEITDGTEYAEIKDGNKLVSKKNGVGNITVVAHSSQTSNYNAGTSVSVVFSMEKAAPTITWTIEPEATMTFTDRMAIEATTSNDDGEEVYYLIGSAGGTASPEQRDDGTWEIVPSKVGWIEITPRILETTNYLDAVGATKRVNITNGLVTFTIADIYMHYGDLELTITPQTDGLKGYDATYTIESGDYQYIANTNGEIVDGKINVLKAKPGQTITVTPSFTLANYTISCLPFTVTIDKAVQSLTWDPTEKGIAATYIGSYQMIDAPVIGFPYDGIENEITYTCSDNQYLTVAVIPGNRGKINVSLLQYSSTPVTITATYAGNGNVEAASTTTPLSITMELQPQKVEWDGVAPTISNIYTTNSTTDILATLKATAFASAFVHETRNIVQFKAETSGKCPNTATLVSLIKNEDNSYSVKYTGDGSGHVKITAFAERGNGYERTSSENEKTIEFDILPAPATVAWSSNEFDDAHYGDIITMTPTITPDKGYKVFTYTFEEGKNLTCQGNVLSIHDVATEGTTITARNTPDCFVAADPDGLARSNIVIAKTEQEIVWEQNDMTLDVLESEDVQLTAYAIDGRHKVQESTCLTLTDSKYITAKTAGDGDVTSAEVDMRVTYNVEELTEEDGFCKITGQTGAIVKVDENGLLHVTGIGVGRVKITPVVSEGAHYTSASGTPIYVTVQKATRTITWNNKSTTAITTASADITLDAHTTYNSEDVSADEEGTKTYSIGTGGEAYVEIVEGVLKIKDNITLPDEGVTITVNVSFANSCRYADVNDSWTFTLTKVDIQLQNVPTTDILTFDNLTSTTKDFDLKTVLITNYIMTTNYPAGKYSYSFTSLNINIATIDEDGVLTAYNMTEDESPLEIVVTATESVTRTFDSETIKIVITRGTLIFNIAEESDDNKWTNSANWSRPDIVENSDACGKSDYHYQMANYNVVINSDCYIGKDSVKHTKQEDFFNDRVIAKCHDLTIDGEDAKLTLAENAVLAVDGKFTNGDASKLLLRANYWGQAAVVFASAPEGHPMATVEMYLLPGSGNSRLPLWQYRGIIVEGFEKGSGPWKCMSVYEWDEANNGSTTDQGCWVNYQRGSDASFSLSPWKGYAFANLCTDSVAAEEQWLTYTGRLINDSVHEFTLTRTNGTSFANSGINLMTNSFSAPMPINSIDFGENNRTVTFYNAGTYAQWKAHSSSTVDDNHGDAGQLSSCPQKTSGETQKITAIPSGQAFFVTSNAESSKVKFRYSDICGVVSPSGRMFERGRENEMYNILTINVARNDNRDRVILVECDSCTRQYDNGYDGLKMKGDDGLLQIYAYNKFGKTAVNADSSFNKQYIGFVASDDNDTYTMSFNTDRLYGYHALYLTDRRLNATVDILAGETYSFKGYTVGEDMRFQINGITEEEWQNFDPIEDEEDKSECDLRIVGKVLYVEGFTTSHYTAEVVEVYDMMGHLVWSTPLTSERIYDLPELPHGIYTIRLGDCHVKYSSMR